MITKRLLNAYEEDQACLPRPTMLSPALRREHARIRLFWVAVAMFLITGLAQLALAADQLLSVLFPPSYVDPPGPKEILTTVLGWAGFDAGVARLLFLARRTRQWIYLWGVLAFVAMFPRCVEILTGVAL
jgi:hypothetical protein